ncbi:uncharacterized protein METZ01_LOCUS11411 [marine metagenome]|uniref:Uncharacterized protein n=1 Tax=marine metagenome TaxID=408172 RepID=A0A381NVR7_9ZZZZ
MVTSAISRNLKILPRSFNRIEAPPPHLSMQETKQTSLVPGIFVSRWAILSEPQARHPGPVQILILVIIAHFFIDIEYQYNANDPLCQARFQIY